jgi:hypothetical protein
MLKRYKWNEVQNIKVQEIWNKDPDNSWKIPKTERKLPDHFKQLDEQQKEKAVEKLVKQRKDKYEIQKMKLDKLIKDFIGELND